MGSEAQASELVCKVRERIPEQLWQCVGTEGYAFELCDALEASMKREKALERKLASKPKPKACAKCREHARDRKFAKTGNEKPGSADIKKIVQDIVECWPDFKRIPDRLWNLYMDNAATCRCGRIISPRRSNKSAETCRSECRFARRRAKNIKRGMKKSEEKKGVRESYE